MGFIPEGSLGPELLLQGVSGHLLGGPEANPGLRADRESRASFSRNSPWRSSMQVAPGQPPEGQDPETSSKIAKSHLLRAQDHWLLAGLNEEMRAGSRDSGISGSRHCFTCI